MKQLLISLAVVTACAVVMVWTKPAPEPRLTGGSYAVNVHFIRPIHRGNCTVGQVWQPNDIQCAKCLCVANRFSRCVPRYGCNVTTATAVPSTTPLTTLKPTTSTTTRRSENNPAGTAVTPAGSGGLQPVGTTTTPDSSDPTTPDASEDPTTVVTTAANTYR